MDIEGGGDVGIEGPKGIRCSGSRDFLLEKPIFIEINYILLNLDIVGNTGPQPRSILQKSNGFHLEFID